MSLEKPIPSDPHLLREFINSADRRAFEALVAKHLPVVLSTALRRCGDRGMAEEATQNAFAILARKAKRLVGHPTIGGWLQRTAMLEAGHLQRAEINRRRTMEKLANEMTSSNPLGDRSPSAADREEIDRALSKLRTTDRDVLLLRYFEGLSFREIGERLGKTDRAVSKQAERSLEKMRVALQRNRALPCTVAAALAGQFAETGSANPALIATSALSASGGLTFEAIAVNTLLTMSYTKPVIITSIVLLALWPLSKVLLRDKSSGEEVFVQEGDRRSEPGDVGAAAGTASPSQGPSAISAGSEDPKFDPQMARRAGREIALIKLKEHAFSLKYIEGPPAPESDQQADYLADMRALMKAITAAATSEAFTDESGNNPFSAPGSTSQLLASMVAVSLGLDTENVTLLTKLEALFIAASHRRAAEGLRSENRREGGDQSWDEGMSIWREQLFSELGNLLSADEIQQIKTRLGYAFADTLSFGMGATAGASDRGKTAAQLEAAAVELESIEALLAGSIEEVNGKEQVEPESIAIPDIEQLGTQIADLFRAVESFDDEDPEAISGAIEQWTTIMAATQVHRQTLEQTEGAASLVSDVLGEVDRGDTR